MDHGESGSGTPFESMSHEEMLAWLDQANSGAIQSAADRLVSAATEIRKIAEDLKVRPQWVEWKGEGADAFRTWSADLANSTLRLGDYSEGASKWLTQASNAIASAQAAIPRTQAGAQANLDAALAARNDPDASAVAQKSAETLIATQEANRQEAAAQMRKLAQTYSLSASQMDGLEKPAFPPPPQAIVPKDTVGTDTDSREWSSSTGTSGGQSQATGGGSYETAVHGAGTAAGSHVAAASSQGSPVRTAPVDMGIDGVGTLPQASGTSSTVPGGSPTGGRPDVITAPTAGLFTPALGSGPGGFPGSLGVGRGVGGIRVPGMPGPAGAAPGPASRLPRDGGIIGGRPVPRSSGRPMGGLPQGTVIGGEGTQGRPPMGQGMGGPGVGGGQGGVAGGRRLAGETGGIVGGRPHQPGRSSARPFTPGGSGLVRGATSTEAARGMGQMARTGTAAPSGSRTDSSRRDEDGGRPDYLTEDEETWQQGNRRVVPPVID